MAIELNTTQSQYEDLHERTQGKGKSVRVDAQALINLLIDHSALIREGRAKGLRIKEPPVTNQPGKRHKANLGG